MAHQNRIRSYVDVQQSRLENGTRVAVQISAQREHWTGYLTDYVYTIVGVYTVVGVSMGAKVNKCLPLWEALLVPLLPCRVAASSLGAAQTLL